MAENKGSRNGTTRRGFLAAVGAGAAALAVPAGASAAPSATMAPARFAAGTWTEAIGAWPAAVEAMKIQTQAIVDQFLPAYLAEIGRLAEELRPRFLPGGDLYATVIDPESTQEERAGEVAIERLEELCTQRFGLEVGQKEYEYVGDEALGTMIFAISPSREEWGIEWNHPCYAATACAGSDVVAYAKRQGWGVRS